MEMEWKIGMEDMECKKGMEDNAWHIEVSVMATMDFQTSCLNTQAIIIMNQNFTMLLIKDIDQILFKDTWKMNEAKSLVDCKICFMEDKVNTETKEITTMKEIRTKKKRRILTILSKMMEIMIKISTSTIIQTQSECDKK